LIWLSLMSFFAPPPFSPHFSSPCLFICIISLCPFCLIFPRLPFRCLSSLFLPSCPHIPRVV
jgi:hypothetical protein